MPHTIVNVSDARVSANPEEVLVTYSLGSCIGVSLWDPVAHCGGLLHYQLPSASLDAARAQANPCMFADTGMTYLLKQLQRFGGEPRRLQARLAGGAEMMNDAKLFSIGRRNHTAIRKILWQHGLLLQGEDVGGSVPRTMYLNIADGVTTIKTNGQLITL